MVEDLEPGSPDSFVAALDALSLADVEEVAGELHRRTASALRDLGERLADRGGKASPRAQVAQLVVATELAGVTLGVMATGGLVRLPRPEHQPATLAAVMYAATSIPALLARLEQDRRLLASLARNLEARIDEECETPWGRMSARRLVVEVSIVQPARLASTLDALADRAEA